jgi:UDP-3-O-[3-hydroxymyristoyl] glucosamine N-acyltransferase
MELSLGELAIRHGLELRGDPEQRVARVGTLQHAGPDAVSFLANPRYRKHLATTRAGAVVLEAAQAAECAAAVLISPNPYAAYARIAADLHPEPGFAPGIQAGAHVDPAAEVAADAHVAPGAVVAAGARVGAGAYIGPNCVVGAGARVGAGSRLVANVTVCHGVRLGARVLLHPGAVIGADGFGLAREPEGWIKVPQLGSVTIGDDVEIGANTTVDRGAIDDTVIEDGVKLDNQIQVAHNVRIGAHTVIAGCTGISGSTTIGRNCMIAGAVGIGGHHRDSRWHGRHRDDDGQPLDPEARRILRLAAVRRGGPLAQELGPLPPARHPGQAGRAARAPAWRNGRPGWRRPGKGPGRG